MDRNYEGDVAIMFIGYILLAFIVLNVLYLGVIIANKKKIK